MSGHFLLSQLSRSSNAPEFWWAVNRSAAKHSSVHTTSPTTRITQPQEKKKKNAEANKVLFKEKAKYFLCFPFVHVPLFHRWIFIIRMNPPEMVVLCPFMFCTSCVFCFDGILSLPIPRGRTEGLGSGRLLSGCLGSCFYFQGFLTSVGQV